MKQTYLPLLLSSVFLFACGDKGGETDATATAGPTGDMTTGDDTTTTGTPTTTDPGPGTDTDGTTADPTTTTTTDPTTTTSDSDTESFLVDPDVDMATECDIWSFDDCPDGQKCMPWANDGGSSWNATKCVDIQDNPGADGDACNTIGSGVSGEDTCDNHLFCYYTNDEGSGVCVPMCVGSPENKMCEDQEAVCSVSNDGVLILCRKKCDPLLQDCDYPVDTACLPAAGSNSFVCIADASGDAGMPGDPCEFLNACDPGNYCEGADIVPNCQGGIGCCTPFCDVNDDNCDQLVPGTVCTPWYGEENPEPGYEHVGGCTLPQ